MAFRPRAGAPGEPGLAAHLGAARGPLPAAVLLLLAAAFAADALFQADARLVLVALGSVGVLAAVAGRAAI